MKDNKKKPPLKCHICGDKATHAIMMELREKPGPAIKENNVIRLACDIHAVDTSFDYWVPLWAFRKLVNDNSKEGIHIKKEFCTIKIVKFK